MKIISPSNENEMIYEFLKMEIYSERHRKQIYGVLEKLNTSDGLILEGDLSSETENARRKEILKHFRGYDDTELFENFPVNIKWFRAVFGKEDINKIKYINYSYWNELSNYTGSPLDAAKTLRSGKTVYGVPNDGFWKSLDYLKDGGRFPPLIFLTDNGEKDFIVLEGHKRMTAYALEPERFIGVEALLGYCERKNLEKWYGVMTVPQ